MNCANCGTTQGPFTVSVGPRIRVCGPITRDHEGKLTGRVPECLHRRDSADMNKDFKRVPTL